MNRSGTNGGRHRRGMALAGFDSPTVPSDPRQRPGITPTMNTEYTRPRHPSEGPDCDHRGVSTLEETGEPETDGEGVSIPVKCTECDREFEYWFDYVGLFDPETDDYVFTR